MCRYTRLPFDGRINKERRICDPYKQIYEYQMNRENMNLSPPPSLSLHNPYVLARPPFRMGSYREERIHFLRAIISSERLQLIWDDLQ